MRGGAAGGRGAGAAGGAAPARVGPGDSASSAGGAVTGRGGVAGGGVTGRAGAGPAGTGAGAGVAGGAPVGRAVVGGGAGAGWGAGSGMGSGAGAGVGRSCDQPRYEPQLPQKSSLSPFADPHAGHERIVSGLSLVMGLVVGWAGQDLDPAAEVDGAGRRDDVQDLGLVHPGRAYRPDPHA